MTLTSTLVVGKKGKTQPMGVFVVEVMVGWQFVGQEQEQEQFQEEIAMLTLKLMRLLKLMLVLTLGAALRK